MYWWSVPNFACIAGPLDKYLKKHEQRMLHPFMQEEHEALATLQDKMVSELLLDLPITKRHLIFETDVCDK